MKIAMPYDEGRVNPHFGTSREFVIFTINDGKVTGSRIIGSEDLCHNHDGLAGLLKDEGVEVVIAGGIGAGMVQALNSLGFKILTGASGDAALVARDYAQGNLVTGNIELCGCSCGDH